MTTFVESIEGDWDVIATSHAGSGAFWFGAQVAYELARLSLGTIRLFTDDAYALARLQGARAPAWSVNGVKIANHRSLATTPPAQNLCVVFDAAVPGAYLRAHALRNGRAVRLMQLGSPVRGGDGSMECLHQILGSPTAGVIKPFDPSTHVGAPWTQASPLGASLRHAGPDATRAHMVEEPRRRVLAVPGTSTHPVDWIDVLRRSAEPVSLSVLSPTTASRMHISTALAWRNASRAGKFGDPLRTSPALAAHGLAPTWLSPQSWPSLDKLICESDLVLACEDDLAVRAITLGTPVIYMPDRDSEQAATDACRTVAEWGQHGCSSAARDALAKLNVAWGLGVEVEESWRRFVPHWDEAKRVARQNAQRYLSSTSLTHRLLHPNPAPAQDPVAIKASPPPRTLDAMQSYAATVPVELSPTELALAR